jgi:hypothetical protein
VGLWKIFSRRWKSSSRQGHREPILRVFWSSDGSACRHRSRRQTLPGPSPSGGSHQGRPPDRSTRRPARRSVPSRRPDQPQHPSGFSPVDAGMSAPPSWRETCGTVFLAAVSLAAWPTFLLRRIHDRGRAVNQRAGLPDGRAGYPDTSGSVDQEQRIGSKRRSQRRRGGLFRTQGALVTVSAMVIA